MSDEFDNDLLEDETAPILPEEETEEDAEEEGADDEEEGADDEEEESM